MYQADEYWCRFSLSIYFSASLSVLSDRAALLLLATYVCSIGHQKRVRPKKASVQLCVCTVSTALV
jgi:hypothetical protein